MAGERRRDPTEAQSSLPRGREGEVRLADRRRLAFVEHGDESGIPVVLQHGTPASRLGLGFADAPARARGVRVICPDRPGIGRSDPAPRRTLLGWADDVAGLADALQIDRFAVVGYSCGGAHALVCAARLAERVSAVALMAGAGPLDRPGALEGLNTNDRWLAETSVRRPRLAAIALRAQAAVARRAPGLTLRALLREVGDADRRHLAALGPDGLDVFTEALRQGPHGVIDDYRRWIGPWPFALEDVKARVDVWHGDDDDGIPMHHSEDLLSDFLVPRCTAFPATATSRLSGTSAQCSTGCWTPGPNSLPRPRSIVLLRLQPVVTERRHAASPAVRGRPSAAACALRDRPGGGGRAWRSPGVGVDRRVRPAAAPARRTC